MSLTIISANHNRLTEEVDPICFDDVLEYNLFRNSSVNNYPLAGLKQFKTKYIDSHNTVMPASCYNFEAQGEYDFDNGKGILKLYLIDKEDSALAEYVADALGLNGQFINRRPRKGYSYVYQIEYPSNVADWPIGKYLASKQIDPSVFAKPNRAQAAIKKGQKQLGLKQKNESVTTGARTIDKLELLIKYLGVEGEAEWVYGEVLFPYADDDFAKIRLNRDGSVRVSLLKGFSRLAAEETFESWNEFVDHIDLFFDLPENKIQNLYK